MILNYLKKPYPYLGDLKKDLIGNLIIGSFVAFFLIVFQPFNINEWQTENKIIKLAGFGVVSFLVPSIVSFIILNFVPASFKEEKWNIGKEILTVLIVLMLIAFGNLLYGRILGIMPLSLGAYASALISVALVGVFPVFIHVTRKHNRLLKKNLEQSELLNKKLSEAQEKKNNKGTPVNLNENENISLLAENEKDRLNFSAKNLLFIESADNYSNIYLFNQTTKREMLRSSLKRIESQISHGSIVRCHRAFIVNLDMVKSVEGNAAGYKLSLHHTETLVPVSRNYIPLLNQKLQLAARP